ncbi:MAG: DUF948 domain-containing protein [Candidatus Geothermincolales bacterium]
MGGVAALVCAISFGILMLAISLVTLKMARTLGITNGILNDLRRELIPLVRKLQVTMDRVNGEMEHVDRVLDSVESLARQANSLTKVAQRVVTSPVVKLLTLGLGAWRPEERKESGEAG